MPLLEYRCSDCGKKTEDLVLAGDTARPPTVLVVRLEEGLAPSLDFRGADGVVVGRRLRRVDRLRRRRLRHAGRLRRGARLRGQLALPEASESRGMREVSSLRVLACPDGHSRLAARARFRSRPAFPSRADGREDERRSSPERRGRRVRRGSGVRELPRRPLLVPRGARFPRVARQARASRGRGLPRVRARLLRPLTIRPPDRPRDARRRASERPDGFRHDREMAGGRDDDEGVEDLVVPEDPRERDSDAGPRKRPRPGCTRRRPRRAGRRLPFRAPLSAPAGSEGPPSRGGRTRPRRGPSAPPPTRWTGRSRRSPPPTRRRA